MKLQVAVALATLTLPWIQLASAEVAPEITVISEGYNVLAKLPCIGCAYLYQDTSTGKNEPWIERKDENALVQHHHL